MSRRGGRGPMQLSGGLHPAARPQELQRYTQVHTHTHTHAHARMRAHVHACVCACMHVHTHTHKPGLRIYTHTHTQTQIPKTNATEQNIIASCMNCSVKQRIPHVPQNTQKHVIPAVPETRRADISPHSSRLVEANSPQSSDHRCPNTFPNCSSVCKDFLL